MIGSFRRTVVAATCALGAFGAVAPAAMAGKPAPAPPPPPTTTATAYSGEAQVVDAHVEVLGLLDLLTADIDISKAGPLPATGGYDHASLLDIGVNTAPLWLGANVASAHTAAAGDRSHSTASVANVALGVGVFSPNLLRLQASVLRSSALAKCGSGGAELSGRSDIVKLKLAVGNGLFADVLVTSAPNQTIHIEGVAKITINKQVVTANSIDVSALEIELIPKEGLIGTLLNPIVTGKIVISRSHADIACQGGENPPPPPPCQAKDWVTGGGQIGDEDASFGMNGGDRPNGLTGHFNLRAKNGGPHLKAGTVTDYAVLSPTERRVTYSGTQDGVPVTIVVRVADNGEGANATGPDTISVTSTGGYSAAGNVGGNIQIHMPKGCSTTTTTPPKGGGKPK
jgi:hypothetical protein